MTTLIFSSAGVSRAFSSAFFEADAGSSWESNVNRATENEKQSAVSLTANAYLGYDKEVSQTENFELGGGYEGLAYLDYQDLSYNGITIWSGYTKYFNGDNSFRFFPRLTRRFYGDNLRDNTSLNLPVTFDISLKENLSTYFGYSHIIRRSNDDQFDTDTDQWFLGLEQRWGQKIRLGLDYSFLYGQEYFYREFDTTSSNFAPSIKKRGSHISTFGVNQEVYAAIVKTQIGSVSFNYDLSKASALQLRGSLMNTKSSEVSFENEVIELNYFFTK
jgi:hypothetical protein